MRIAIGSDERTILTDLILEDLKGREIEAATYGALQDGMDSRWPVVARQVGGDVANGICQQGVLLCWTGTGVSIAANKIAGVRAALCTDAETARGARLWNDANILCMSLRLTSPQVAREMLDAWFSITTADPEELENIDQVCRSEHQQLHQP